MATASSFPGRGATLEVDWQFRLKTAFWEANHIKYCKWIRTTGGRCSPACLRRARWEPVCTHTCADLKKKKSHKKQHLCYRDVFNKYYRKSTSYQKELPGPEGAINRNSLHFKVFPRRVKNVSLPWWETGGAVVKNLLAAFLLPASLSRAAL